MAFQTSIANLNASVKALVLSVTQDGTLHVGKTEKDQVEVSEWIDKVGTGDLFRADNLNKLDAQLVPRTYIATNYLTAADVALYGALHPIFSQLRPQQYYSHPSLTRYFDHIQSSPPVRKSADTLTPDFSFVSLDIDNAPKSERKIEAPKKKEKSLANKPEDAVKPKAASRADIKDLPLPAENVTPTADPGKGQKAKKEKPKKDASVPAEESSKKVGAKNAVVENEEPVPSMIDLRVGHIVDIMKHPDADGLYVEQIDIGEESGPRTVVSGLVHYIPIEEMRDKYLIAVCNLKPANMRGVKSFAMVLCATSKDGKDAGIELIQPPPNSKPGDRVYFEGADFESATPLSQLNPKKKIFETIQPGFITLDSREAAWVNPVTKSVHKIRTKEGVCVAPTLVGASLS